MENPKKEFVYGACMRNQATNLGGHVTDGCQAFFPTAGGFHCGACDCHQNIHQKIVVVGSGCIDDGKGESSNHTVKVETEEVEVSVDSQEEEKEEKQLQELMVAEQLRQQQKHQEVVQISKGRRPRTKFTEEQRHWMFAFAKSLGWSMHKNRWDETNQFYQHIGVPRHVFKAWLHNHKNR
ncbi:zinc-finger homeodomain protein 11-like [Telopea speciosissima]|uniref:zinc-finger homeodomain protein 11-like n=1 Tax=Telopea speciosissima TaxID=54955 RepID=UPI001CC4120F|nr:zinc-finger homeodomain protein 11-like [Telopea speciosissima]